MYLNVKAELARREMTLVDLSNVTGIKYMSLIRKINGQSPLTLDEAKSIKEALRIDTPLDELFEVKV